MKKSTPEKNRKSQLYKDKNEERVTRKAAASPGKLAGTEEEKTTRAAQQKEKAQERENRKATR